MRVVFIPNIKVVIILSMTLVFVPNLRVVLIPNILVVIFPNLRVRAVFIPTPYWRQVDKKPPYTNRTNSQGTSRGKSLKS